ncbi:nSTAND1 domain-containing NTPase [Planktothrix agardhii]|uniref:nSTAND1 domain-containing NTPase n=1 Tax=Planktothrix agardhii TaxID=1160 RepID=UPI0004185AD2|nr:caspase family protein [Planktothrix agardhii]
MSNFQHSYALVIGINNYNNGISSLKTAVSDATEIAHILESKHGYTVTLLVDNAATLSQIRQVLETELPSQIQKGDRFLFYFAGHGIALNGEDGPEGYLVPQDAKSGSISTYLRMSEVNKALLQLPCRHFLGILDCCFAGAFRWSSTRQAIPLELLTLHKERYDRFIQDPAWQVITSAAYDQTALDAFDLKDDRGQTGVHSPFANALIAALEGKADAFPPAEANKPAGDGVITASELYLYLREQVEIATEVRAIRQTPGIYPMNKHDKGEYIFLTPGHALNLPPAPPLDVSKNPYRGLLSFGEEHSNLFFGRSALTQKLYDFVTSSKLTVVLGASGSGKSSLVKAGLIPKIRQFKDSNTWFILPPFRPGESPFKALNNALASVNQPAIAPDHEASSLGLLTPGEGLGHWFTKYPQGKLLLVVDQFEELITLCQNDSERQQFLAALAGAIATYPNQLHVILTLRSDFEPQFRNTVLEKDWQTARFIVPAMKREELREAIEAPASARVMYFDPHELVEQLIDEVANMPGALPLLSFALSELYLKYLKRQEDAKNRGETIDRAITQADYQELGGVTRSLTQRADQEYEELVKQDPAYSQTIRNVMLRMVAVGGELARRRVPMSELEYPEPENTRVKTVIQYFSAARLLTHGIDSEAQPYVEPAHDALVRGWQKLLQWKQQDLVNLLRQRELTPVAIQWADSVNKKQSQGLLWDDDPRLPQVKAQLKLDPYWLNQEETTFVNDSKKRKQQKSIFSFLVWLLILGVAASALWYQNQSKRQQLNNALIQSSEFLSSKQPLKSLENAIQAGESVKNGRNLMTILKQNSVFMPGTELEWQAINGLQKIGYKITQLNRWQAHTAPLTTISFDPKNDQIIASASEDGTIKFWHPDGSQAQNQTLKGRGKAVWSLSFSPDGSTLISGSRDQRIRLWNKDKSTGEFKEPPLLFARQHTSNILGVAFSSDGNLIASAGEDKKVNLWNKDGTWLGELGNQQEKHKDAVYSVSFSPKSSELVTAGKDGIKLWNIDGTFVKNLYSKGNWVYAVSYSPDGYYIASGHGDGTIKLWKSDGTFIKDLTGHSNGVRGISFSPDSSKIASAGQDRTVKLWDVKKRNLITTFEGHGGDVRSVSFNANGSIIASAGADNTIQLWKNEHLLIWKTEHLLKNQVFSEHTDVVFAVDFSNDGLWVATASADRTIRVLRRNNEGVYEKNSSLFTEKNKKFYTLAFSPDNSTIASADEDGQIILWQLDQTGHFSQAKVPQPKNIGYQIRGIAFNSDGSEMASTSSDKKVRIWKKQDNGSYEIVQTLSTINAKNSSDYGLKVTFSPNNQLLALAHEDGTVKLWKKEINGQFEQEPFDSLSGHTGNVNQVVFGSDSSILASAGSDGIIQVWQRNSQGKYQSKKTLKGHNGAVYGLAFHSYDQEGKNHQIIASAGQDYTVKLWNLDSNQPITLSEHTNRVFAVAFSPDGKTLASVGWDKKLILWNLDFLNLDQLLEKSCAWAKPYLNNSNFVDKNQPEICLETK